MKKKVVGSPDFVRGAGVGNFLNGIPRIVK